jgi:hypothetical protein
MLSAWHRNVLREALSPVRSLEKNMFVVFPKTAATPNSGVLWKSPAAMRIAFEDA